MEPLDDSALLRQYAEKNSDDAFAALVSRHVNLVYSVALRRVGNPHHAGEITQTVFIILAKKAWQLRHGKALSSWLFQTAQLTANNYVRSEMRRHFREQEAYVQSTMDESNEEVWRQIAPMLDAAVAALGEKDRRAVVLRFYEGKSLREIGAALDAGDDAAEKRVARALEKLRRFFTKRGVSSTTAILAGTISGNSVQAAPAALAKSVAAVAIAKGTAASGSTLTLKGTLKIMAWTKTKAAVIAGVVVLLATGTTTVVVVKTHGASFQIKEMMKQKDSAIRTSVFPAIIKFAREHQDEIPKSMAALKPYIPVDAREFDDDHWRISASGKLTPLLVRGDVVLFGQKNVPPGRLKIMVFTDGHIEWK